MENLLNRKFKADYPNQKWVTDISFIHIGSQRLYLSAIMDLYNNEIVAYELSNRNDNQLVLNTIRRAVEKQKDVFGIILHSNRGYQYTSGAYHDMLHQFGVISSMYRKGNCYDNACIESFFSHLKTEALYTHNIQNVQEAQKVICEYIQFYNLERIQIKLNQLPPVEYRRQNMA
ncbi:IS3 family transposase [Thermoactinomyces mirandus]|uniref:IS3 family transposase n=1 Tax=Thermoactinomyces mirandus TaxID=2756294 RepID=UPI0028AF5DC7|nr:IS3 family transposase [Thermoactinomyces mirandus]